MLFFEQLHNRIVKSWIVFKVIPEKEAIFKQFISVKNLDLEINDFFSSGIECFCSFYIFIILYYIILYYII